MIVFVEGKPATAGSKKAFPFRRKNGKLGVSVVHDNPAAKGWMEWVRFCVSQYWIGPPTKEAIRLYLTFVATRPASHYTKNGTLKSSSPENPVYKPDLTKMTRAVEDALTGLVWVDDSQVCWQVIQKEYGDRDGVLINVIVADGRQDHGRQQS